MISTIALLATLGVIIWHTIETRRLRKATVKQADLQLTPFVLLDYGEELKCKNVGNGSAINVRIEPLEGLDASNNLIFKVNFLPLYVLEPKESKQINYKIEYKDAELEAMASAFGSTIFSPLFQDKFKVKEYPLTMLYENLENVRFRTEAHVKVSEIKISFLSTGKT